MPVGTRLIAVAAALVLLCGAAIAAVTFAQSRKLQVGVVLPFSGPNAPQGLGMRNAIRLAVDEVNGRGGVQGRKVTLVEFDDASTPERAAAAAQKLIDDPSVVGALLQYDQECSAAVTPMVVQAKLPNIVAGVSVREAIMMGGKPEFIVVPLGTTQMERLVTYAWDTLGARRYVYIADESRIARNLANEIRYSLTAKFEKNVVGEERVHQGDRDFSALVAKVRAADPQYVFFAGRALEAGLFLQQLRAAGIAAPFQFASHYPSQEFIDVAGAAAEGAIAVFHGVPPEQFPEGRAFLAAYAAHGFAEPPGAYGIYAYAAAQALLGAMERSFLTRPSVAGALAHEQVDTALGKLRLTPYGSTYQTVAIWRVQGGRWAPVLVTDDKQKLQPFVAR